MIDYDLVRVKDIVKRSEYNNTYYQFLDSSNNVLFSNKQFIINALRKYRNWLYVNTEYNTELTDIQNLNTAIALFKDDFINWHSENVYNFTKAFNALKTDYNPLENYDRQETGGWTDNLHKGTKTSTNVDSDTAMHKGTRTATNVDNTLEMHKGTKQSTNVDSDVAMHKGSIQETNANMSVAHHKGSKETTSFKNTQTQKSPNYDNSLVTNAQTEDVRNASDNIVKVEDLDSTHYDKDVTEGTATNNYTRTKDIDSNTYDHNKTTANATNNYTKIEDIDSNHFDKNVTSASAQSNYTDIKDIDANTYDHNKTTANANSNYTIIEDIDSTHFDKNVHEFNNYRIRGNIGVTTSQQMLESELNIRQRNLIAEFIADFFNQYTFYLGGVC